MPNDDFWDVIQFKKLASGKYFAVKIGSAKKTDKGGFNVNLDALPLPTADGCSFTITPRRDNSRGAPPPRKPASRFEDDEVPF